MARRVEVEITPGACISWALMLLILPLRWVLGVILAAAIHELWHYAAIRLCGGDVFGIRIRAGGAVMLTAPQTGGRELLCAAAGPFGSFSLLLAAKYLPVTAVCGLVQGMFNLLPLFPLDGGRILRGGIEILFPNDSARVSACAESACMVLISAAVIYGVIRTGISVLALILGAVLVLKLLRQKNTLQRFQTKGTIETD